MWRWEFAHEDGLPAWRLFDDRSDVRALVRFDLEADTWVIDAPRHFVGDRLTSIMEMQQLAERALGVNVTGYPYGIYPQCVPEGDDGE